MSEGIVIEMEKQTDAIQELVKSIKEGVELKRAELQAKGILTPVGEFKK